MKPKNTRYLVLLGVVSLLITVGLISLDPLPSQGSASALLIRAAALWGYQAVFLSILSSLYLRELVRFFGRPFVKVHHVVAVGGLVLITVHPLTVALRAASAAVFLPRFDSFRVFLTLGGRVAWPLIVIATLAALFRRRLKVSWRFVHLLNYVAFLLASVHAALIGTTFVGQGIRHIVLRIVVGAMAASTILVFVQKRRVTAKRQRTRT
ncbi:MAG: hypothetical protein JXA09_00960 [Anaerolineae bacterium]|nr:hypothetical protein [Anaerolineae bacterium]